MKLNIPQKKIEGFLRFLDFTRSHPHLSRVALRLAYKVPRLKMALPVSYRIYMGGRILESYRVDAERGEISFASVDRQIVGSEYLEVVFRNLAEAVGKEKARRAMYDMHFRIMKEQLQALDLDEIFPRFCASLFREPVDPALLEKNPSLARLYGEMESMLLRLLFSESGWGSPTFDTTPVPGRVTMRKSVESQWIRPSEEPVCYAMAGSLAAFVTHISGEKFEARETRCAATGEPDCTFVLERKA
jgi:predicted hydrocarbon binding protein